MAFDRIRRELRHIRQELAGERFERTHDRHRISNHAIRITVIAVGAGVMLVAALTFWIPGPNFLIVLAGLALVAGQWRFVARLLDRGELRMHRWHDEVWEPMPRRRRRLVLSVAWLVGAAVVVALGLVARQAGVLPF